MASSERRFTTSPATAVNIETRNKSGPIIYGYAAVFWNGKPETEYELWSDDLGRAVERIHHGAFDAALKRPDEVVALFNHNADLLLGRNTAGTLKLSVDKVGLKYEIQAGDSMAAREMMEHLSRGDVKGSSFCFRISPGGQKWTTIAGKGGKVDEIRDLLAMELSDVSPCTTPAYKGTSAGLRGSVSRQTSTPAPVTFVPTPNLDRARLELAERLHDDDFYFRLAEAEAAMTNIMLRN